MLWHLIDDATVAKTRTRSAVFWVFQTRVFNLLPGAWNRALNVDKTSHDYEGEGKASKF